MAEESPVSREWLECSKKLSDDQKFQVYEKRDELRIKRERERRLALSDEERAEENRRRKEWFKKSSEDLDGFYGNMGNPEYPE